MHSRSGGREVVAKVEVGLNKRRARGAPCKEMLDLHYRPVNARIVVLS
jgi:hypothetical protein